MPDEKRKDSIVLKLPDVATYEDVRRLMLALLKSVKGFKDTLSTENKSELLSIVNKLQNTFDSLSKEIQERVDTNLKGLSVRDKKETERKIEYTKSLLLNEIKVLRREIPEIDLAPLKQELEKRIEDMEKKIPTLPKERDIDGMIRELKDWVEMEHKKLHDRLDSIPRGVGGVTNLRIQQAFKYILKTEQPVGAIDGANLTYSLSQPIFAILSMSLNGETIAQLPNYTINGRNFTFSSALPSAYSGKDWEVKYI